MKIGGFGFKDNQKGSREMLKKSLDDLKAFCEGTASEPSGIEILKQQQQEAMDKIRELSEQAKKLMEGGSIDTTHGIIETADVIEGTKETTSSLSKAASVIEPSITKEAAQAMQANVVIQALPPALPMKPDYSHITPDLITPSKLDIISPVSSGSTKPILALPAPKKSVKALPMPRETSIATGKDIKALPPAIIKGEEIEGVIDDITDVIPKKPKEITARAENIHSKGSYKNVKNFFNKENIKKAVQNFTDLIKKHKLLLGGLLAVGAILGMSVKIKSKNDKDN